MQDADDEEIKPVLHHVRVGLPGGSVLHLELLSDAPLSTLVDKVLEREHLDPESSRIRLIIAGKLFSDHTLPVKDVVPHGGFIHCAISNIAPADASQHTSETSAQETHIPMDAYNLVGEIRIIIPDVNSQVAFNRLSRAGFTADEIRMIRRHVRALRREARNQIRLNTLDAPSHSNDLHNSQSSSERNENEGTNVTIRTRPRANPVWGSVAEGTNKDFLLGCIFGYLLGIMVLVLLMDSHASRRWRVGIIAGVATNCAFGILRTSIRVRNFTAT